LARRISLTAWFHLAVGVAMAVLVIAWHPGDGDPLGLFQIAAHARGGAVAYQNYAVEYPPLGLAAIGLAFTLGGTTSGSYQTIFSILMLGLAVATGTAVYWLARRRWSTQSATETTVMFTGLALASLPLVIWRFDILPALLTVLALVAYAAHRPGWSGLNLGLGIVAKVYSAFLIPVLGAAMVLERRWRDLVVLVAAAGVVVVAVLGESFVVAGNRMFYFLVYQRNRGVEIESLSGGIAMLSGALQGTATKVSLQFGSMQVDSSVLSALAKPELAFDVVTVALLVLAALFCFRRDIQATGSVQPATIVQYTLATLLAVVVTNKVLSPQYIIWLLPFVPLMGPRKSLFFLAICVLTVLGYPLLFPGLIRVDPFAVIVLNVRNALLLVFLVWVAWPRRVAPRAASAALSERGYVREPAQ
jgi:hypothetical protein